MIWSRQTNRLAALVAGWLALIGSPARAWDYEAHRVINQLALAALPTNFPAFVAAPEARERLLFLSGEPDRWRNAPEELSFSHATAPDHYFDLEELQPLGLNAATLPIFRHEFAVQVARARAARPGEFPPLDANRNRDHTREWPGFLPWALAEQVGRLKSAFACLQAFEQFGGTPDEIANARANVLSAMGVLGHFVGDATQPLHTTKHHQGWVGANPKGYTTDRGFHQWIDGDYFAKTGGVQAEPLRARLRPARLVDGPGDAEALFRTLTAFLLETHQRVEPLYRLQQEGKFSGEGLAGLEGRLFLEEHLVRAAQMLGDLWFTAWRRAPEDSYLRQKLSGRQARAPDRLRVLVVVGGHDFERQPFLALFTSLTNVTFRVVQHPSAHEWFRPAVTNQYDVVVLYDMWQQIAEPAKTDFLNLARGGKGFVVLHHAIANYNEWDDYAALVGGRYYLRPKTVQGIEKARSQYQHDVRFTVRIADPAHPVTRGLSDFGIQDETYKGFDVAADSHPVLKTDEPLSGPVIGWARTNGASRWVYVQLGHDHFAFDDSNYRRLVGQAIRWVAGME